MVADLHGRHFSVRENLVCPAHEELAGGVMLRRFRGCASGMFPFQSRSDLRPQCQSLPHRCLKLGGVVGGVVDHRQGLRSGVEEADVVVMSKAHGKGLVPSVDEPIGSLEYKVAVLVKRRCLM